MKKPLFIPIILAIIAFLLIVFIPNKWIASMIPKDRVKTAATALNPLMFQGEYMQSKMLKDGHYLPIYGSSELSRLDCFHPSNYFKENNQGFTPFLVGRGGSQSLIQFLNFAAHSQELKGKKLVFILSAQWFKKEGLDEKHFAPNYSILQGYDLAFNEQINPIIKKKAMKRLEHFNAVKNDKMLSILYKAETTNNPRIKWQAKIIRPAAKLYRDSLYKKDLYFSLLDVWKHPQSFPSAKVKGQSWTALEKQAEKIGEENTNSNSFYIINSVYHKLKPKMSHLKNIHRGYSYGGQSVEYNDFQLVLDVLKESGAKPLFVIVPLKGKWSDYEGLPKKGRIAYYTKIKNQIRSEGFPVADFSNHEYDPYFLKDTIHLGWKGWVDIDKSIEKFYTSKDQKKTLYQITPMASRQ